LDPDKLGERLRTFFQMEFFQPGSRLRTFLSEAGPESFRHFFFWLSHTRPDDVVEEALERLNSAEATPAAFNAWWVGQFMGQEHPKISEGSPLNCAVCRGAVDSLQDPSYFHGYIKKRQTDVKYGLELSLKATKKWTNQYSGYHEGADHVCPHCVHKRERRIRLNIVLVCAVLGAASTPLAVYSWGELGKPRNEPLGWGILAAITSVIAVFCPIGILLALFGLRKRVAVEVPTAPPGIAALSRGLGELAGQSLAKEHNRRQWAQSGLKVFGGGLLTGYGE